MARPPGRPPGYPKSGGGVKKAQAYGLAGVVRGHLMRAIKGLEHGKNPTSLTELLEKALREDVNATLGTMARWVPKELLIDANISTSIIDTLAEFDRQHREQDAIEVAERADPLRH